jgi:hypothetical protein
MKTIEMAQKNGVYVPNGTVANESRNYGPYTQFATPKQTPKNTKLGISWYLKEFFKGMLFGSFFSFLFGGIFAGGLMVIPVVINNKDKK